MATLGTAYLWGIGGGAINKESVMDAIFNIDPFETPLMNLAPKVPARHTTEEWIEDTLDATASATTTEGRDFSADNLAAPSRKTNITHILGKDIKVSETQVMLDPYGFDNAFMHEVEDGTKEIMRNAEISLFYASGNSASGASATARRMKSLQDFISTNAWHCTDSATLAGGGSVLSAQSLEESTFNTALQKVFEQGGNPSWIFIGPAGKRQFSTFDGQIVSGSTAITLNVNANERQITRAVNTYASDFGPLNVILDRWVPQATATSIVSTALNGHLFGLEIDKVQVAMLRPLRFVEMGRGGDNVRGQLTMEYTLRCITEAAHFRLWGVASRI